MNNYSQQIAQVAREVPRSEVRKLLAPSDRQGWLALISTYVVIVFCFSLVYFYPSLATVLLALMLLGGRQLALAILAHEAAHRTLFASRVLNEWVGKWLCAYPVGIDLVKYRAEHLKHHQFTGGPEDPDLGLVTPYPVTRGSLTRKFFRDVLGITGLKRLFYLGLMGLEVLTYSASTNARRLDPSHRRGWKYLRGIARNFAGPVLVQTILFSLLFVLGNPQLYLLWLVAYLSPFSLFLRIRAIAEHACTGLWSTRTTHAGFLARLTVAPHRVNFHLEHHLFMQVPQFNLPKLNQILTRHQINERGTYARDYLEVLRIAGSK